MPRLCHDHKHERFVVDAKVSADHPRAVIDNDGDFIDRTQSELLTSLLNKVSHERHDKMVALVDKMLDLHKQSKLPKATPRANASSAQSTSPTNRLIRSCMNSTG